MTINTVTHEGQTYVRQGKAYSHAVITTVEDGRPLVEWASTRALAEKNASAREHRVNEVRAGRELRGVFSTDWHRRVIATVIVEVTHA